MIQIKHRNMTIEFLEDENLWYCDKLQTKSSSLADLRKTIDREMELVKNRECYLLTNCKSSIDGFAIRKASILDVKKTPGGLKDYIVEVRYDRTETKVGVYEQLWVHSDRIIVPDNGRGDLYDEVLRIQAMQRLAREQERENVIKINEACEALPKADVSWLFENFNIKNRTEL